MGFHRSPKMRTCSFQLDEGKKKWMVRGKTCRFCWIYSMWNYRSTFTLLNFDLCPGRMVCVGYIPGFSGFQLRMASRDPRQAIRMRASIYSHGSFLVKSLQISLNLTQHHCLFQGNLTFFYMTLFFYVLITDPFPCAFRPMGNDSTVLTSSELLHNPSGSEPPYLHLCK